MNNHNQSKAIAIVYHSAYGRTEALAKAIASGVKTAANTTAILYSVEDFADDLSVLDDADAIVFGSPTYMGSVSAAFKTFMDKSSKAWSRRAWKDKFAAGFTHSTSLSGDKLNSLIQMAIFASQHGMIWVGQDQMTQEHSIQNIQAQSLNRMGVFLGAVAQTEHTENMHQGDLLTARALGERVAKLINTLH